MSQQVIVVIGRLEDIEKACPGWVRPMDPPRMKTTTNPFTNAEIQVRSHLPEGFVQTNREKGDLARLRSIKPFVADFTIPHPLHEHFRGKPALLHLAGTLENGFFELSDLDLDIILSKMDGFEGLESVNSAEKRAAAGVKGYFWLYSF